MESLFLRVFVVSGTVSVLLLPLLLCRGRLEKKYAPQTRWWLWLVVALVLLTAPWLPKPQAPVVVEAPAYTVTLPVGPVVRPQAVKPSVPNGAAGQQGILGQPPAGVGQAQIPDQSGAQSRPADPAEAQTTPSRRPVVSVTALAAAVWLAGMALLLLWQGGRYLLLRLRLLSAARPVSGLEGCAGELGLEGRVAFYCSGAVSGPMTLGLFRPLVLLPLEGAAPAALRHELYHVKRRDVAYKLLVLCACVFHWFNPLVWGMLRAAARDVEACCDAAVVEGRDNSYKRSYGELLLASAGEGAGTPFTTSFSGGAEQMKARLTQLFRPGKQSRALVCGVLVLALALGSLVACRQEVPKLLADGVYCSPLVNITWPIGEEDAEGEDYGSIGLSLLEYSDTEGPHGKPLGDFTLPLSDDLMLRQLWWGEDQSAGEKGTEEWRRAVGSLLNWPVFRDSMPSGTDYLVVTVKSGEITRLSWAMTSGNDTLYTEMPVYSQPLTENTMPTLDYYDPEREFLLYHTLDTAYFYYGDALVEEYHADQSEGKRVIWRCDVSGDEQTVYLSDVFDDREGREERFYAWDIEKRELRAVDSIPGGVDHMTHVGSEELFYSGFMNGTTLKSNVLKAKDGTLVGLYINEQLGNTIEYLQLSRMDSNGAWAGGEPFLTPDRIPSPRVYTDPDWGFSLTLPESLEGNYVVLRAANNWNFYDKALFSGNGYLFSLWAEDSAQQQETIDSYPGEWDGKILGEKDGITYTATFWDKDMTTPAEQENGGYMARMEEVKAITADDLDLTAVTRSSGDLWPLPYIEYGSDVVLEVFEHRLRILSPEGVTVQSMAAGTVEFVKGDPGLEQRVVIRHPDGRYSQYDHLEYVQVHEGDEVKRGDILGFAKEGKGKRWILFSIYEGDSWETSKPIDPLEGREYRTYDFRPVTREALTIAGDPAITAALRSTLRGDTAFYNVEAGEYQYVDALPDSDGAAVKVYRFAEQDMDGDTIPEVVLWLERGGDEYVLGSIILSYRGGQVYGHPVGYRTLNLEEWKAADEWLEYTEENIGLARVHPVDEG